MQGKVEICGVNTGKASYPERRGEGSICLRVLKREMMRQKRNIQRKFKTGSKCDQTISFQ